MPRTNVTGGFGSCQPVKQFVDGEKAYRSKRACELTGISYRQLDYWDRTDFIKPSLHASDRSGSVRYYSSADLRKLALARRLLDAGFSLEKIRDLFATFRDGSLDVGKFVVIIDQKISLSDGVNWIKNYDFDCAMIFRIKEVPDVLGTE